MLLSANFIQKPPDEVGAYATKANRSSGKSIPGLVHVESSSSSKKKATSRALKNKDERSVTVPSVEGSMSFALHELSIKEISTTENDERNRDAFESSSMATSVDVGGSVVDTQKRVKALKKKLRDITTMEQKPADSLSPDQRDKMAKKASIEAELNGLLCVNTSSSLEGSDMLAVS